MTARRGPILLAVAVSLLVALGAGARTAHAEDAATRAARRHFTKGEKLFALGRFDDALIEYEKAFEARPLPAFLFNIGQCHRNLGNVDQAIFSYRKYLREQPDADNREAVERLIEELEAEQARQQPVLDPRLTDPAPAGRPRRANRKPIYARWWFWGGVAAVAGAGAGTYLLTRDASVPATDLGNVVFD